MKNFTIITITAALLFGATACGGSDGGPTGQPSSATAQKEAPAPAESKDDGVAAFGEVWKYDDGVTITVSKPSAVTASDTATKAGAKLSVFTVTIMNGTKDIMTPLGYGQVNYGAEGVTAEQVYDSAQGLMGTFSNKILPGKKATVKMAFEMPATAKDVLFSISPDMSHSDAIFSNK